MDHGFDAVCLGGGDAGEAIAVGLHGSGRALGADPAGRQEAERYHREYSAVPPHHWSEWYPDFIVARVRRSTVDDAARGALRHDMVPS